MDKVVVYYNNKSSEFNLGSPTKCVDARNLNNPVTYSSLDNSPCVQHLISVNKVAACLPGYKTTDNSISKVTCTDSDADSNNGINYNTQGTVTWGPIAGKNYSSTDGCSADGKTLTEYSCETNGYSKISYYTCPTGYSCSNGACKPTPKVSCGKSNGIPTSFINDTTSNINGTALCDIGSKLKVPTGSAGVTYDKKTAAYNWKCIGATSNVVGEVSCSAKKTGVSPNICGAINGTQVSYVNSTMAVCAAGSKQDSLEYNVDNFTYSWKCIDSKNSSNISSCSASKKVDIVTNTTNVSCADIDGTSTTYMNNTSNPVCAQGTKIGFSQNPFNGIYSWKCVNPTNSSNVISCSASQKNAKITPKVSCGESNGIPTTYINDTATNSVGKSVLCGSYSKLKVPTGSAGVTYDNKATMYNWKCIGATSNVIGEVSCSAKRK